MTDKFRKTCELYKIFAADWNCDFSDEAMEYAFRRESYGEGDGDGIFSDGRKPNGYIVGKKWLNVQVTAWRKDLEDWKRNPDRCFIPCISDELFADPKYKDHHEWLIDVLGQREALDELTRRLKDLKEEYARA